MRPNTLESRIQEAELSLKAGNLETAAAQFSEIIVAFPDSHMAWFGLGCARTEAENHAASIDPFRKTIDIKWNFGIGYHNLGRALCEMGEVDEGLYRYQQAMEHGTGRLSHTMLVTVAPLAPSASNELVKQLREGWAKAIERPDVVAPPLQPTANRKLRIGYVSSYFDRQNWMKPVWGVINNANRDAFELHLFVDCEGGQVGGEYNVDDRDRIHNIHSLTNSDAANLIRKSELDLLVDLNGFSKPMRLGIYTERPAPKIASWFNMFATSGMKSFDAIIGDDAVCPPDEFQYYTEPVHHLPCCYLTYEVNYDVPDVAPAPFERNGYITFGSRSSQYKITPTTYDVWAEVLNKVPGSRFSLRNKALKFPATREYVLNAFFARGIEPDRLDLAGPADHFEFLRSYDEVDIAIDTFPYSGGTTTSEALWQGVPTLTCAGDRWVARTSRSLLHYAGLDQFIAKNADELPSLAAQLVSNQGAIDKLRQLRIGMRDRLSKSSAMDVENLARQLESTYTSLCQE